MNFVFDVHARREDCNQFAPSTWVPLDWYQLEPRRLTVSILGFKEYGIPPAPICWLLEFRSLEHLEVRVSTFAD